MSKRPREIEWVREGEALPCSDDEINPAVWEGYVAGKTPVVLFRYVSTFEQSGAGGTGINIEECILPVDTFPSQLGRWLRRMRQLGISDTRAVKDSDVHDGIDVYLEEWARPLEAPCNVVKIINLKGSCVFMPKSELILNGEAIL